MERPHRRRPSAAGSGVPDGVKAGAGEASSSPKRGDSIEKESSVPAPAKSLRFLHRIRTPSSVLALAADEQCVFAGLQGGKIQGWSLTSYELILSIDAHEESVLCLYLAPESNILFSSGGDRIVNVWSTSTFERLYSIHSYHDVGDLFSLVYSSALKTFYCGAQNASIQWHFVDTSVVTSLTESNGNPLSRQHRFFDSTGPGGISTPPKDIHSGRSRSFNHEGEILSFKRNHFKPFAHNGYVSCLLLTTGLIEDDPQSETLVSGGGDGTVKLWNLENNGETITELDTLDNGDGTFLLSLCTEDDFLYCGLRGGTINIWGLESRQLVRAVKSHYVDVLTLNVLRRSIFSGGSDGIIMNLNAQNDRIGEWKAHEGKILASSMTQYDRKRLFITGAGSQDTSLAFWDASGEEDDTDGVYHLSNDKMIKSLAELVAFRTVSSKPGYASDSYQAASFLRKLFSQFGAQTLLLNAGTERNPIVFARFSGNLKKSQRGTILFYGHYDVINAEDHLKWDTDPFTLSPTNSYLYGRGVSDNKGPVIAALYAAGDLAKINALPHDTIFLIEGEEESGSRGFEETVQNNKDLFGKIDWILLSNSYWLDDHIPCLTYGLRGVIQVTIQIDSDHPDLHSGIDGSSMLDEPVKDLILLLSSLVGPEGMILIPHFYMSILDVTQSENARYEAISDALHESHPEIKDTKLFTQSLLQRWTMPTFTVHRFDVSGPRNTTTIPKTAKADISIRLVPKQDARDITSDLVFYLHTRFQALKTKNHINIKLNHLADPWLGDPDNEIFQTLEEAVKTAWAPASPLTRRNYPVHQPSSPTAASETSSTLASAKSKIPTSSTLANAASSTKTRHISTAHTPLYIREGGSIPAIRFLEKEFGAPAAQFPCGQASDHAHLDNERLRVDNLYKGREVFRRVFGALPAKRDVEKEMKSGRKEKDRYRSASSGSEGAGDCQNSTM